MVPTHILLVDDNPDDLLALESILGHLDVSLVKVTSGKAALRSVLIRDFVVLIIDIHLGDISGIDLASLIRLRSRSSNTPIIFTSAYTTEEIMQKYNLAQNKLDFVSKPFNVKEVIQKVLFFIEPKD